jgi:hypothetical protein
VDGVGFATPEQAVLADDDIPDRYVTVLGSRAKGDEARVWLLMNDRPPFEEYECVCVREDDGWHEVSGSGSFSLATPREIRRAAENIRSRFR